jgi:hypothetical protein
MSAASGNRQCSGRSPARWSASCLPPAIVSDVHAGTRHPVLEHDADQRWAAAVVTPANPTTSETLVLDTGRSAVLPLGFGAPSRVDAGRSPLGAAAAAVQRDPSMGPLSYAGYLGEQRDDTDDRSIAWSLFVTDGPSALRTCRSSTSPRWVTLDEAIDAASRAGTTTSHLHRAQEIIAWRRAASLPYSTALGDLVWRCSQRASDILAGVNGVGLGICGSGARGDFIDGWSDVDLIGWGMAPSSPAARKLRDLVTTLQHDHDIDCSLDLADANGRDAMGSDPLYNTKLRALFQRRAIELEVVAGSDPPESTGAHEDDHLEESLDRLHRFVVRHLATGATSERERTDRARRILSVACTAGRSVTIALEPQSSIRLPEVVSLLRKRWPGTRLAGLLADYGDFRQGGATDICIAEGLAAAVPDVLAEMCEVVCSLHPLGGFDAEKT